MMNVLPVLLKDGYKVGHKFQYPNDAELVYSNMTPRKSRVTGVDAVVPFGMQYFVKEYMVNQFKNNFFDRPRLDVMKQYNRRIKNYLGRDIPSNHIAALHELGYLPLHIKAIPEGLLVPMRVPTFTVHNTLKEFAWLTNMLETLMSNVLWLPTTSATTAFQYRKTFEEYAKKTGADPAFVKWQGHDFSMRGLPGIEAALLSGAAHLLSFTGTDTIPAIDFLEEYYGANSDTELIGGSIDATEHSVMSMGGEKNEIETIRRLITEVVPTGPISIVCDTWDFWKVLTEYLPALKDVIMARNGKVVVRPDSGDPVLIVCGDRQSTRPDITDAERRGAIQVLWDIFGGTKTTTGHRVLDAHIGLIYGDSITKARQEEILSRLAAQWFASSNVVLGIGSYTYQYVTRDTYGIAMKATYGETKSRGGFPIFKDPKTDDGMKKSATGLLRVRYDHPGHMVLDEKVSWEEETKGLLQSVFLDGTPDNFQTVIDIRARIEAQL